MTKTSLIFILIITLLSCSKDKLDTHQGMWDCHTGKTWNQSSNEAAIVGEWQWRTTDCSDLNRQTSEVDFTLNFRPDHIVEQSILHQKIQEMTWTITEKPGSLLYFLDVEPNINNLSGLILFCEDRMEINNSFQQGCDRYFVRK